MSAPCAVKTLQSSDPVLRRYLREYTSLGTAGGLYHFRDAILKGSPSQIFVINGALQAFAD